MRLIISNAATGAALALAAPALASSTSHLGPSRGIEDQRVLVDVIELPSTIKHRVQESGRIEGSNDNYAFLVYRSEDNIVMELNINNRAFGQVRIISDEFPNLDLSSLETFSRNSEHGVSFIASLRYGERSDCFSEDDGRSRIRVHFGEGGNLILNNMTFRDCEPSIMEVPADSTQH